jgi:hypothetical protein
MSTSDDQYSSAKGPIVMLATNNGITDRKPAEQALRERGTVAGSI